MVSMARSVGPPLVAFHDCGLLNENDSPTGLLARKTKYVVGILAGSADDDEVVAAIGRGDPTVVAAPVTATAARNPRRLTLGCSCFGALLSRAIWLSLIVKVRRRAGAVIDAS